MAAWRILVGGFVAAASVVAVAEGVGAQSSQVADGKQKFEIYCASCHGAGAKGDGPFSATLRKRPADLTQLAGRNKGEFPKETVARLIDGRTRDEAHRKSDMPVWGDVFAKSESGPEPAAVKARIDALVEYLATIQAKAKE